MAENQFPFELIKPTLAVFEGDPNFYTIVVTITPFELEGESYNSEIILEGLTIPNGSIAALANREFEFPVNPDDGYVDGSMYFGGDHNPVDLTHISFGAPNGNRIPAVLDLRFIFEHEGTGYANAKFRLCLDIEHRA